jgi:hypothetical protein
VRFAGSAITASHTSTSTGTPSPVEEVVARLKQHNVKILDVVGNVELRS